MDSCPTSQPFLESWLSAKTAASGQPSTAGGGTFSQEQDAIDATAQRRRELARTRQARFAAAHRGEIRTVKIPARLHAALKTRARAAGIPLHRYVAIKAGVI